MSKSIKKILFIGLFIFTLLQFYQPAPNADNGQLSNLNFTQVYTVPEGVRNLLRVSCYDCHSNNTNYRWYDYIQPARIFVESHIKNAKKELNFSEWGDYSSRKQQNKLERIIKQIKVNEMPLPSYTLLHRNTQLSNSQKSQLISWINQLEKNNE